MSQAQQDPQTTEFVSQVASKQKSELSPELTAAELTASGDTPKFGRLLIILFIAVMLIIAITFASEAYYSN